MLKIDLTIGAFRITSDEHNYILHQCKPKTKGKDAGTMAWSVVGYYGKLDHVADAIARCIAADATEDYPVSQLDDIRKIERTIVEIGTELAKAVRLYSKSVGG